MTEGKECCSTESSCSTKKGLCCPITGCPIKHVLIATVVVFAVTFGFDFLFHGLLLKANYEATAALWRPEAEMQSLGMYCIVYHAILALGVAGLYCLVSKNAACGGACWKTGIRFGILPGLTLGIAHFSSYIWMPIPLGLALKWLIGSIIWGILTGFILSCLRKKMKCCG